MGGDINWKNSLKTEHKKNKIDKWIDGGKCFSSRKIPITRF